MQTRNMKKRALEIDSNVIETCGFQTNNIQLIITEKREEFEVNIDFDEASEAWRKNKKSIGNGHYKYVCEGFTKTGKKCVREPDAYCAFCNWHNKI